MIMLMKNSSRGSAGIVAPQSRNIGNSPVKKISHWYSPGVRDTTSTMNSHNYLTIDVEDFYQVSAFEPLVSKESWSDFPSRVEQNTTRLLDILDEAGLKMHGKTATKRLKDAGFESSGPGAGATWTYDDYDD